MIDFAVLEITDKCNLRCKHCYGEFTGSCVLTMSDIELVLNNLLSLNCKRVTLSGGEPFLVKEIFEFAKMFKDKGMQVGVVTNGTVVSQYSKDNFDVFDYIQISVDGSKEIHEKIRGNGTFDRAIDSIKVLKEYNLNLAMQITINHLNQYCFEDVLELSKMLGVRLSVERVSHSGNAKNVGRININNYKNIIKRIVDEKLLSSDPLVNAEICERYSIVPNDVIRGCSAGHGGIAIDCDLNVFPCVRLRINMGNLYKNTIQKILVSSIYKNIGNREKLTGNCGVCKYKFVCGGCRADAWSEYKDYHCQDTCCLYP
ncbi:radical SAM protein [Candidatus Bathycorpusculum sp.]|uniref:radical SAM/SPASM domain-containing protein n=1 Tax=Candidatus Bathycorpusculum sp. TaxID=2994959 RepID=UPI00282B1BA4|nr:radical SAM protein [Candidatus Termitimicrobium sp.]